MSLAELPRSGLVSGCVPVVTFGLAENDTALHQGKANSGGAGSGSGSRGTRACHLALPWVFWHVFLATLLPLAQFLQGCSFASGITH